MFFDPCPTVANQHPIHREWLQNALQPSTPSKADLGQARPKGAEPGRAEPNRTEWIRGGSDQAQAERSHAEPNRADPTRAKPSWADMKKV